MSREVSIAQIPLQSLRNRDSDVLQQKQLLGTLNSAVADVGSSLSALGKLGQNQGLGASSSNSSLVSVVNSGAATPANYTISNITSTATAASETSLTGYADSSLTPVSSSGNLNLVLGSNKYSITLDSKHNNLIGLRDAINALGVGVNATVLTTATGANPNYLSLSAANTGQTTLQLNDIPASGSPVNLLTSNNQGTNANFQLNGVPVSQASNTISSVVPGLTFTILGTTSANQNVTISASTDPTQLSSALQDFATKYNTLVDQVNAQVGPAAGLLSGDFIITQVESALHQTLGYQGSNSSIQGLANLGLTSDTTGKLTFDQNAFNQLSPSQLSDAFKFLGSSTTGLGGLAANFTALSDPVSGLIKVQEDGYTQTDQQLQDQINKVNDQVNQIQTSVTARLQAADAAIAQLQSQQTVLTASVQSVDLALFGKDFGVSQTPGG